MVKRFSNAGIYGGIRVLALSATEVLANDACDGATDLSSSLTTPAVDTFTLRNSIVETNMATCGVDEDIWVKFEVPATGGFTIETDNFKGTYDPYFRVYEGGCASLTAYDCDGTCNVFSTGNCSEDMSVVDPAIVGDTVWVRIANRFTTDTRDSFSIDIKMLNPTEIVTNDACESATDLTASLYTAALDTFTLKNSLVETNMPTCGVDEDVWVKFEVPATGGFKIETDNFKGTYDQYFRVNEGGCASLTPYACDGTCNNYTTSNCGEYLHVVNPALAGDTVWVRIANRFNSDTRDSFSIDIKEIAAADIVDNDSCGSALDLTSIISVDKDTFSLANSIVELAGNLGCGQDDDVWFKFEVPSSGAFSVQSLNVSTTWNPYFSLYSAGCASLDEYDCDGTCNYYDASGNCSESIQVANPAIAGDTLWMRLSNRFVGDNRGDFSLQIDSVATVDILENDSCGGAIDLTAKLGVIDTFDMANCGVEMVLPSCGEQPDVWFKFEVPANGAFDLQTRDLGSNWLPQAAVYTGGCAALSAYDCQGENCHKLQTNNCGEYLRVVDPSLAGDTLWVRVAHRFFGDPYDEKSIIISSIADTDLPENDDCSDAEMLQVSNGSCSVDTFSTVNATYSTVPTNTCGSYTGADVWFSFVMPASDEVFVELSQVSNTAKNFRVSAFSGGCGALLEEVCNASGNYPSLTISDLGLVGDTVLLHVYITNTNIVGDTFGICIKDTNSPDLRVAVGQYETTSNCPTINESGWFNLVDSTGNLIASIDPAGNNLGRVCYGINVEDTLTPSRTSADTAGGTAYLAPRNFYLSPQYNFRPANIRLYFKEREIAIWRDSLAAAGVAVGPSLEVFYEDSMRISKTSGGSLINFIGDNPIQINPTVTKIKDSILVMEFSVTSFSNFTPIFNPGSISTPVPVSWLAIGAKRQENLVDVHWSTAAEVNCSHYEVQRSSDGRTFKTLGVVSAMGTTNSVSQYRFLDERAVQSRIYYRIKQIDFDGNYDYSKLIAVQRMDAVQISPNPFSNQVNVSVGSDWIESLVVLDLYGRELLTKKVDSNSVQLELGPELNYGMYVLRIVTSDGTIEKRIVKR